MKYKRILLKLSGEALAGESGHGISGEILENFTSDIQSLVEMGTEVGIVIGGGNIHRGVAGAADGMDRSVSDHMGMLATIINSIALCDKLTRTGIKAKLMTTIDMDAIGEHYTYRKAQQYLDEGNVVIFGGGTGNPYFTTDTASSLKACEIGAEVLLKATKVDGVYDKDPAKHSDAVRYDKLSFTEALNQGLKVMDSTAFAMCMENDVDIIVFDTFKVGNMKSVVMGEDIGTKVTNN
ncbi:MAG: UMP kinase [Bacteriovoracaceae bacterium]|nr:UMP kinase [Bacteriovoracaceae bacterium]